MTESKKLYRSKSDRIIAGVCGGLGEYLDIDPIFIRLAFVLLTIFGGAGILIYIIMFLIVPEEEDQAQAKTEGVNPEIHSNSTLYKSHHSDNSRGRAIAAFILILTGLLFLSNSFFPNVFSFNKLWPLLLIVIGIIILTDKKKR